MRPLLPRACPSEHGGRPAARRAAPPSLRGTFGRGGTFGDGGEDGEGRRAAAGRRAPAGGPTEMASA